MTGNCTWWVLVAYLAMLPACDSFASSLQPCAIASTLHRRATFRCRQAPTRLAASGSRALRCDVTTTLATPLGIVFEEVQPGEAKGLIVSGLVSKHHATRDAVSAATSSMQHLALVTMLTTDTVQVPGGNAERDGKIQVGDKLISTSAVVFDQSNQPLFSLGAASATTNWKREMIACGNMDFSTIMTAIKSNRSVGLCTLSESLSVWMRV